MGKATKRKKMARRNVRVDVPISSPEEMKTLVEAILAKVDDGTAAAELDSDKIDTLRAQDTINNKARTEGRLLHGKAEAKTEEADKALGVDKGQSINTVDTIYNIVALHVRETLLLVHQGEEEKLSKYGFNVVISGSSSGGGGSDAADGI